MHSIFLLKHEICQIFENYKHEITMSTIHNALIIRILLRNMQHKLSQMHLVSMNTNGKTPIIKMFEIRMLQIHVLV